MMIFLDTHVALWLYFGRIDSMSDRAKKISDEEDDLRISAISLLEMSLLKEVGKIAIESSKIANVLEHELEILPDDILTSTLVHYAADISWTRDPFDRLLVAHSMARKAKLLTRDRKIREHFEGAVW